MAYTVTAYSGDKITVGSVVSRNEFTTNVDAGMRGDTGYAGSTGYTGSQGAIGYTGSVSGNVHIKQLFESVTTYSNVSGEIQHDCSNGTYLFIIYPTGNMSLNLTNLDLNVGEITTIKTSIVQPEISSAFMVQSIKVNDIATLTYWENGVIPTGNTGKIDDIKFEVYQFDENVYVVKGTHTVYDEV